MKRLLITTAVGLAFLTGTRALAQEPTEGEKVQKSSSQPDFKVLKDDFIPGEKTLFYDDFTDMAPDEAPPHWKVRGASPTLMEAGSLRQLITTEKTTFTPLVDQFPQNFTVETEVLIQRRGRHGWYFYQKGGYYSDLEVWTQPSVGEDTLEYHVGTREEKLGDGTIPIDLSKPIKQSLWIQNGRLRFYVDGRKIVEANQVKLPPLKYAEMVAEPLGGHKFSYRVVRIAESTPDFSQTIAASGRYVTHGIHFDTDSDRLQPDSGPVLKSIAAGLQKNPNLKLRIEGHTDSTGKAAHNLDLSKRRAEAVKAVLVGQFSVDAERLTVDGLGASKPMDSNDTPQGRAQNRRVEFVRQ